MIEDCRKDDKDRPMRQSYDVSHLNDWQSGSDTPHAFIYEAQTSCVVAGSDVSRWVGYCFVESYFDVNEEARETVMAYLDDSNTEEGVLMDPCTFGRIRVEDNIKDPREWFLVVFQSRLNQIKGEWRQVVRNVDQSVREYEKVLGMSTPFEGDTRLRLTLGTVLLPAYTGRPINMFCRPTVIIYNQASIASSGKPKSRAKRFGNRCYGSPPLGLF